MVCRGVRNSWLMLAKNCVFSASSRESSARCRAASRSRGLTGGADGMNIDWPSTLFGLSQSVLLKPAHMFLLCWSVLVLVLFALAGWALVQDVARRFDAKPVEASDPDVSMRVSCAKFFCTEMACRVADPEALEILMGAIDHLVQVTDTEVAQAMRDIFACTHNVAEGAGAASFAAAMQERTSLPGQTVGITLCGGNVDSAVFAGVLRN